MFGFWFARWRRIETAPDGKLGYVLVKGGRHQQAEVISTDGAYLKLAKARGDTWVPTHYMPLPK